MSYPKLRGAIVEKYQTIAAFSEHMPISCASLSAKLNGKTEWKSDEIVIACKLLDIPPENVHEYFFYTFS